jgi:hypothetical protein
MKQDMKQTTENCKGCNGCLVKCIYYSTYKYETGTKPKKTMKKVIKKIMECPCTTCIVKVVCKVGCDEYSTFSQRIISRRIQKTIYGANK